MTDDGRGAIAHWIDRAFGMHWPQRIQSIGGLMQAIVMTAAGLSFGTGFQWGIPWIDKHWNTFVGTCFALSGIISGVKSRLSKTVPPQPPGIVP